MEPMVVVNSFGGKSGQPAECGEVLKSVFEYASK